MVELPLNDFIVFPQNSIGITWVKEGLEFGGVSRT